jgi:Na+/melibiose symporter-like transporter
MATSLTDLLKYLSAILLIQIVTVLLVLLAPEDLQGLGWLRLIVPLLVVAIVAALWLNTLAAHQRGVHLARADRKFAREREKIRVNAERAKSRVIKQAHKDIARETRSAHAKANVKVGAAFAAAFGAGALMLLTQFMTLGGVTLTAAGGALGGYLYRARRDHAPAGALETPPPGKVITAETLKIGRSDEHS